MSARMVTDGLGSGPLLRVGNRTLVRVAEELPVQNDWVYR